MMGKTLMKKAGELEADLKHEMSELYLKLKGAISEGQKARLKARLVDLERLLTGEQEACVPCSGTRMFAKRK
jgi:hypothetical protein